jgi:hypothetical protein
LQGLHRNFRTRDNNIGCCLDQRCRSFRDHIIRDIKTAWDHKEVLSLDKAMKAQLVE